jgi:phage gpG-like protein
MSSVPVELYDDVRYLGGTFQDMENGYNAADYSTPLESALPEIIDDHATGFALRQDPNGSTWPPLAAYTIKKKGHDIPLVETGRLKASVLDLNHPDHIGGVSHRGLLFGTDVEYGLIHQEGGGRIPQRAFIGLKEKTLDKITDAVADAAVDSLKMKV